MPSVRVSDRAKEILESLKRDDLESYSEAVIRL